MNNPRIYQIDVFSKKSGKHALYFYVKAVSLQDAVVYAADWLIPDALEMKDAREIENLKDIIVYGEIYDSTDTY